MREYIIKGVVLVLGSYAFLRGMTEYRLGVVENQLPEYVETLKKKGLDMPYPKLSFGHTEPGTYAFSNPDGTIVIDNSTMGLLNTEFGYMRFGLLHALASQAVYKATREYGKEWAVVGNNSVRSKGIGGQYAIISEGSAYQISSRIAKETSDEDLMEAALNQGLQTVYSRILEHVFNEFELEVALRKVMEMPPTDREALALLRTFNPPKGDDLDYQIAVGWYKSLGLKNIPERPQEPSVSD